MRSQACALKVKDIMTPSVVSVSAKESVEDAARLMTRFGISSQLFHRLIPSFPQSHVQIISGDGPHI